MLTFQELTSCRWNTHIAEQLALYHKQELNEDLSLWKTLDNWLTLVPDSYGNTQQDEILKQSIGGKDKIKQEVFSVSKCIIFKIICTATTNEGCCC